MIQVLLDGPVRPGTVTWIGLRPARHADLQAVSEATLDPASGLVGDHYGGKSGTRQVSLIAQEDIEAIASFLGRAATPALLRRNIVTAGFNLQALKHRRFRLGTALLEYTGDCHPCSRMNETLGEGGYNAVRGHGGILARVLECGTVTLGDLCIRLLHDQSSSPSHTA